MLASLNAVISTNESTGHMIYNPAYTYKLQLKTTKAYVHDVYEQISQHISDNRYRAWPRVKQFLQDLEPGSILCDVGKFNYLKFMYSENATKI